MKWWWPIWGEVPAEPEQPEEQLKGVSSLAHTKDGNKHVPKKHAAFPNKMNRNKRMP